MVLCMTVFISPQELYERIKSGKKQTVLDVSWEPEAGKAWQKFQSEHIPTAVSYTPRGHAGPPRGPQSAAVTRRDR